MTTKSATNTSTTKPETMSRDPDGFVDVATLSTLLRETEEHHGAYEASGPTHNWWDSYAPYLDARLHGSTPVEASDAAGRHMESLHSHPEEGS